VINTNNDNPAGSQKLYLDPPSCTQRPPDTSKHEHGDVSDRQWNLCAKCSLIDDVEAKDAGKTGDHWLCGERQAVSSTQHRATYM